MSFMPAAAATGWYTPNPQMSPAVEEGGADLQDRTRRARQSRLEEGAMAGLGLRVAVGSLGQPVGRGEDEDVVGVRVGPENLFEVATTGLVFDAPRFRILAFHLDETEEVDGVKLGDHPRMRRMYSNIGRNMGEGRLQMPVSDDRKGDITTRKDEIHAWQHSIDPKEREKYNQPAIQTELAALYKEEVGSEPVVGAGGRTL